MLLSESLPWLSAFEEGSYQAQVSEVFAKALTHPPPPQADGTEKSSVYQLQSSIVSKKFACPKGWVEEECLHKKMTEGRGSGCLPRYFSCDC